MSTNKTHVAIIGGGCAGLSAASALVERGISVTIFETSSQLGARARTVAVENQEQLYLLNNGQHILLGAYQETLKLLQKIGVDENLAFLRMPLQMHMVSAKNKNTFSLLSEHYLPAPLNLLTGFLLCSGLSFSDRIKAIRWMLHLKKTNYKIAEDIPLERYLIGQKQTLRLTELLWEPLCLAALNTPIAYASTRLFLNVLKDSFSGKKTDSDFLLPKLDLSQIIALPLSRYIRENGGIINLNMRIRSIQPDGDNFLINTKYGTERFSHVIVATSAAHARKLIALLPELNYPFEQLQSYHHQPIYSIYFQYAAETTLLRPMTGITGGLAQWVFDRGQLCGQKGLIAVIISAKGKHQKLTQDELALDVAKELNYAFPELGKPLWYKVIAEKRATFSCVTDLPRPTHRTALSGLYLAGDYTYADYPATIEGAVRSGIKCAELIT